MSAPVAASLEGTAVSFQHWQGKWGHQAHLAHPNCGPRWPSVLSP